MSELELPRTCKVDFPNEDDLLNFKLKINPDEGLVFIVLTKIIFLSEVINFRVLES